jgi:hypothetical protein
MRCRVEGSRKMCIAARAVEGAVLELALDVVLVSNSDK